VHNVGFCRLKVDYVSVYKLMIRGPLPIRVSICASEQILVSIVLYILPQLEKIPFYI
jgi:hypothetical protein